MAKFLHIAFFSCLLLMFIQYGCEKRFDTGVLPNPNQTVSPGDTSYVEIFPPLGGFGEPRVIMVGRDQLLYVADYERNEVVMLDAAGVRQRSVTIPHPISLAQNSKLDIYVGGEAPGVDTKDTIGAIYRISLVRFDTTYVSRFDTTYDAFGDTIITPIIRDTSFFYNHELDHAHKKIVWQEAGRPDRRFSGIAMQPDNGYMVTRVGPDNTSFVDPDCRVLLFNNADVGPTYVGDLITRPSGGTAISDIRNLTGIMTFPGTRNFIVTQSTRPTDGVVYGAIQMTYSVNKDFEGWLPAYDPAPGSVTRNVDFIRHHFENAAAVAYDGRRRDIFIVDADRDSVVKFNFRGQFRAESFGRYLTSQSDFPALHHPMGVAFSGDCTLYIADTGNKVIRRFKLSIQTQCF